MARWALRALLAAGLLGALLSAQGDFDLADAFDDGPPKPTPTPKRPSSGGDDGGFSLDDALGGDGHNDPGLPSPPRPKPNPNPNPKQPGTSSGGFSDADLDGAGAGGGGGGGGGGAGGGGSPRHEEDGQTEPQGLIPGILGAVVVAVAGAVSSFIAYQRKKLCFKGSAEQGDISLENHRSVSAERPVQQTLLAK